MGSEIVAIQLRMVLFRLERGRRKGACSAVEERGRKGREGERGGRGREGGRERWSGRRSRLSEEVSGMRETALESRNKSTQIFKRGTSRISSHPLDPAMDIGKARNLDSGPLKQYWSSGCGKSPRLPQSLRQRHTPSPFWSGAVDDSCSRGECITPSDVHVDMNM